jgi:hypothetical protein
MTYLPMSELVGKYTSLRNTCHHKIEYWLTHKNSRSSLLFTQEQYMFDKKLPQVHTQKQ